MSFDINDLHSTQGSSAVRARLDVAERYQPNGPAAYTNGSSPGASPVNDNVHREKVKQASEEILNLISAAKLLEKPAPKRTWLVDSYIPQRDVTLLAGDGGIGKSLIGLQLCAAAAAGREWMGIATRSCPSLYVSCEDDEEEIHFRLERLQEHEPMARLDRLHILDRAGKDNVLAVPAQSGGLKPTRFFDYIERCVKHCAAGALVLDAAADLYGGDENNRAQVRSFIQLLRGIAMRNDCAVVLLAHPSVDGMKTGRGYAGTTAWNASVRSRLYFTAPQAEKAENGADIDTDTRILELAKTNRAKKGLKLCLRWKNGVFVPEGSGDSAAFQMENALNAEVIFLALLDKFENQNRRVSTASGINYAPHVFAQHPDAKGISKDSLKHAMERLLSCERIHVVTVGPPSRNVQKLARVS